MGVVTRFKFDSRSVPLAHELPLPLPLVDAVSRNIVNYCLGGEEQRKINFKICYRKQRKKKTEPSAKLID